MNKDCIKTTIQEEQFNDLNKTEFESNQNLIDFFYLLLNIAKKNKKLWEEINQNQLIEKNNL